MTRPNLGNRFELLQRYYAVEIEARNFVHSIIQETRPFTAHTTAGAMRLMARDLSHARIQAQELAAPGATVISVQPDGDW